MTLEHRDSTVALEVRADKVDEFIVSGLAVPYGEVTNVGDYQESFERGAFADHTGTVPLFYGHQHASEPIGNIIATRETEAGLEVDAKISLTSRGKDVYQLVKDGVLQRFSIGFRPVAEKIVDGVTVRTKAILGEVSVVPFPAYAGAAITQVRTQDFSASADETQERSEMTVENTADVTDIRESVEDLTRQIALLKDRGNDGAGANAVKFTSLGEFVKGLANRSVTMADAAELTRAYTGATTTDANVQPGWVARDIKLVDRGRTVLNLFSKDSLPASGMSVEYPKFGSTSGDVAEQAAEGDDLTYIELVVGEGTAPVKTYGGYSELSRQTIERADVPYLNKVLDVQKISYGKVTNGAVRTVLTAGSSYGTHTIAFADKGKPGAWIDTVTDAVGQIDQNSTGLNADVWVVSLDQFKAIASIVDTAGRPVFVLNGDGSNTIGNVSATGLTANVAGLRVVVDAGLTGVASYIVSGEALTVMESGPFNLADENIINLSKAFSLYGYLAVTLNDVKGVVKVTHAAS